MAIEKMMLLNLVGSLEDEHQILEELVLCENIHLNIEHGDIYDNNYIVHQYEAMMPHDDIPILENYAEMGASYSQMEEELLNICKGMKLEAHIDKRNLKKQYSIGQAKKDLQNIQTEVGDLINVSIEKQKGIEELLAFRKKAICIEKEQLNFCKLNELEFFNYQLGLLSKENNMQIKKNYENISAVVLRIGSVEDCQEDIYLIVYPMQFEEETNRLLKSLNWIKLKIPEPISESEGNCIQALDKYMEGLQQDIAQIEKEILKNKEEKQLLINTIFTRIKMEQKILELKQDIVHGNNLFVLNAWVTKQDKEMVEERIGNITDKFVVISKDAKEIDKKMMPPTKLKNNWLFRPFESIVRLYGLPSYYEIDPTPFLALTFIVMFGIMFGDIGQGFVYFLVGCLAMKKSSVIGGVLTRLGMSSMVFGCIYGSFFGLEQHHLPWLPSLTGPVLSPENIMPILLVGVAFGVIVLSVSFIIGITNALRRGDIEEGFFGKNGVAGYTFFMGFVFTVIAVVKVVPLSPFIPLGIMGLMLVVMILKEPLTNMIRGKKPYIHGEVSSYFIESIFEGVETILGALSNGISFIRVGAFALNHAGLFMAFLVMAEMIPNAFGKFIVLLLGNLLILTLEGLVVFIQGLRLQYYEMFSKYFKGDGIDYTPVKLKEK
ncbi:MAG: V-type ATP synthase subunit I [Cellulosilyticaceae bacterium]